MLDLLKGDVVGMDYRILRPLSEGGMGAIYVAEQISTGRRRALKVMLPKLLQDARSRERFVEEARVGARIESDHIVEVVAAGVDESRGTPWLAMELLEGQTLEQRVCDGGRLSLVEARAAFRQLAHALGRAHSLGIIHRDLKPENLFLAEVRRTGGRPILKVLDFGIASFVQSDRIAATVTSAIGSPLWMAPEQATPGSQIRPATDVWALGLIAFYALTGRSYWLSPNREPFTLPALLGEIMALPLPSASARLAELGGGTLPQGFDAWFAQCVCRGFEVRFADATLAMNAIDAVLRVAPPPPPRSSPSKQPARGSTVPFGSPQQASTLSPAFAATEPAPGGDTRLATGGKELSRPQAGVAPTAPLVLAGVAPTAPLMPAGVAPTAPLVPAASAAPIASLASSTPVDQTAPASVARRTPSTRRRWGLVLAASVLGALLIVLGLGFGGHREPEAEAEAGTLSIAVVSDWEGRLFVDGDDRGSLSAHLTRLVTFSEGPHEVQLRGSVGQADLVWLDRRMETVPDQLELFVDCRSGALPIPVPAHRHAIQDAPSTPFCLDEREVSVRQYTTCSSCSPLPMEELDCNTAASHPVNCLTHREAELYCESVGGRLPSRREWIFAAQGRDATQRFPWGNEAPTPSHAHFSGVAGQGAAGGTLPTSGRLAGLSPFGIGDLSGNVAEWLASERGAYPVIGGSWADADPQRLEIGPPTHVSFSVRSRGLGVRCAHDLP